MVQAAASVDRGLFLALNGEYTSPFLDAVMPFITEKGHFVLIIVAIVLLVLLRGKKRDIRGLVIVALTVLVSDFLSASLKHLFVRVRPCHALEGVRLLAGCGGSYSFPSSHATNIFAAMVFLSTRYVRLTPFFLFFALAVAYSRVYVGVHYPADVVAGAALGTVCAFSFSELDRKVFQFYLERYREAKRGY